MNYKYCSICGSKIKRKGPNLACTRCPFVNYRNPRPTVTAVVLHKNKLLLTKRGRAPFKGWWDLPGGFMNRGESPEETIIRELKEETGLRVKLKKLLGIYPGTYPDKFDPFHVLSIFYWAESPTGKLGAYDDVAESRWFSLKALPSQLAFDSNQNLMKDLKKLWK